MTSFTKDTVFKQQGYTECKSKEKKKHGLEKPFKINGSSGIFPTCILFYFFLFSLYSNNGKEKEKRQNTWKKISVGRNAIIVEWEDIQEKEMYKIQRLRRNICKGENVHNGFLDMTMKNLYKEWPGAASNWR